MLNKVLYLLWQFFFVNGIIFIGLYYYDSLPKILNVIILFFVLPFIIAALPFWIRFFIANYYNKKINISFCLCPLITSLLLWLPLLIGTQTSVYDYLQILKRGIKENINVEDIESHSDKAYLSFKNAKPQIKLIGKHIKEYYNDNNSIDNCYYVVPVLSDNMNISDTVSVWIVEFITQTEMNIEYNDKSILNNEHPKLKLENMKIQGFVDRDPYDINNFYKAIEYCYKNYRIKVANKIFLIKLAGDCGIITK